MKKLLFLILLALINCMEKNQTISAPQKNPNIQRKEKITAIEINTAGGQLGYISHFVISKDLVLFQTDMTTAENKKTESKAGIEPKELEKLFKAVDLEDFKRATQGQSRQPVDGVDQTIIITIDKKVISKMNAYENKTWNKILELRSKYVDQE